MAPQVLDLQNQSLILTNTRELHLDSTWPLLANVLREVLF